MARPTRFWVIVFVSASGLMVQPVFGQGRGGSTAPPGGGSSGAGAAPTAPTTTRPTQPTPTPTTQQPTVLQQPIFITGRVMTEDGEAPTEPVVIERVCNGSPHSEGYTDSK